MTGLDSPRLRQVALVAHDLEEVAGELQDTFGWPEPFHDPGVGEFGLINSVFAAGNTFVEVVSPVEPETTAGRYLKRRGQDSGYMAIFQVPEVIEARKRVADAGIRVVWSVDLDDIAGTHLHPKDVPGAIVSLDWAEPAESWRWAGPQWIGGAPSHSPGGVTSLTIKVKDPIEAAKRWALVLDVAVDGSDVPLRDAGQDLRFRQNDPGGGDAIVEVGLVGPHAVDTTICGVHFVQEVAP